MPSCDFGPPALRRARRVFCIATAFVIIKIAAKDGTVTEVKVAEETKVKIVEKRNTTVVVDPKPKKDPIINKSSDFHLTQDACFPMITSTRTCLIAFFGPVGANPATVPRTSMRYLACPLTCRPKR